MQKKETWDRATHLFFFNSRKLDRTLTFTHSLEKKIADYPVGSILNMTMQFSFIRTTNSSGKKYHIIAFYI